jgi:hypothetical protein
MMAMTLRMHGDADGTASYQLVPRPRRGIALRPVRCSAAHIASPAICDAVTKAARLNGVDFAAAEVFDDGDAAVVRVASQEVVIFASSVRAETVTMIGLATLSFVDPVPEVTVYATWREQDSNPAVPLFLSAVEEVRTGYAR